MFNARQFVFEALLKTEKSGAYSNITLDSFISKHEIGTRDKAFVSALFYGIIERKLTIDYQLSRYLSKPLKKLKPEVLIILEIGVYQLLFMDKVPASAAVNESILLSKKNGCSFASGLINAVLRKVSVSGIILPDSENKLEYLSIKYSCPEEYIEIWFKELGESATVAYLESTIGSPEITIRVNTAKTTADELIGVFEKEGVTAEKTQLADAFNINLNSNSIDKLDSYRNGLFHVQDLSCQICASCLGAQGGYRVFDMCSAPGGKAFTVAELIGDEGEILCFDIHQSRVELINSGARRLNLKSIKATLGDASVYNEKLGLADAVLCDVPCSGLGIIRRKPEIKYKKIDELSGLPDIQYKILENSSRYVKEGGTLLYSTCTLLDRENKDVCKRFLSEHQDFYAIKLDGAESEYGLTLLPGKNGGDGFFICVFKRKGILR